MDIKLIIRTEPLYTDTHPYYVEEEGDQGKVPNTELDSLPEGISAATDAIAPAEAMITQAYVQRAFIFLAVIVVVVFLFRRRRSAYDKLDEKSMA